MYLEEIEKSVETINDIGILDHTIAKLLPTATSLRAHLVQPTDNEAGFEIESFEIKKTFPPQKNQIQQIRKTKLPFK